MGSPTTISCPKNIWTKIGEGVTNVDVYVKDTRPAYNMIYLPWRSTAPATLDNAAPVFRKNDSFNIRQDRFIDVYIYPIRKDGSVIVYNNSGISQNTSLFNRPVSTTGLPSGSTDLAVNGSVTPQNFYIEALAGERLSVSRFIMNINTLTDISQQEYGDLVALTNGMQVYFENANGPLSGLKVDLLTPLTIKTNEDWGRWCYDSQPIPVGATGKTQTWQARWTLSKYNPKNPYGIVLEEGDKLGIIVNDDISGLSSHTVIAEGTHLRDVNPAWISIIP